jgi:hypothetical protein
MQQLPAQRTDRHGVLLRGVPPVVTVEFVLTLVPRLVLPELESVGVHPVPLLGGVVLDGRDGEHAHLLVERHAPADREEEGGEGQERGAAPRRGRAHGLVGVRGGGLGRIGVVPLRRRWYHPGGTTVVVVVVGGGGGGGDHEGWGGRTTGRTPGRPAGRPRPRPRRAGPRAHDVAREAEEGRVDAIALVVAVVVAAAQPMEADAHGGERERTPRIVVVVIVVVVFAVVVVVVRGDVLLLGMPSSNPSFADGLAARPRLAHALTLASLLRPAVEVEIEIEILLAFQRRWRVIAMAM